MRFKKKKKSNHAWICSLGLLVFELSELEAVVHISLGSGDSKEHTLFPSSMKVEGFLIYIYTASGSRPIEKIPSMTRFGIKCVIPSQFF